VSEPTPGISIRHAQSCLAFADHQAVCGCKPSYQAHVWSPREEKRIRKRFPTLSSRTISGS
jgi:hypothetical protein